MNKKRKLISKKVEIRENQTRLLTKARHKDIENETGHRHWFRHGGYGVPQTGIPLRELLLRPGGDHHVRMRSTEVAGQDGSAVTPSVGLALESRGRVGGGRPAAVYDLHLTR